MLFPTKFIIFALSYFVAFEAAECVAATNTGPQGTIGITVQTLRVSDGNSRVEWNLVITNCEARLVLVSDSAIVKLLSETQLADPHGEFWHVRSTKGNTAVEKDHFMFIRARKSFEKVIETGGLESQSTPSKGPYPQSHSLEYHFDAPILITDPEKKKEFVYRCLGTGKAALNFPDDVKSK